MKKIKMKIKDILYKFGYDISRIKKLPDPDNPHAELNLKYTEKIVDLEALAQISLAIPGMISPKSGQFLYALCYMQQLQGDVVEVGSWQGRSTSFLARAVQNSNNGRFFAIDHFKGNVGREHYYIVGNDDLSDLKNNFLNNMEKLGLSDVVNLLNMPNDQAVKTLQDVQIRFLFIDGDHTKSGVKKDIDLFFPKLLDGAIIVFDDFTKSFPGLIEAVDELMIENKFSRIMSYNKTLVIMK